MNSLEKLIPKQIEHNKKMMEMIMETKKIQKHYENKTNDIKKILKKLDKNIKIVGSYRHPNDIEDRKFKEIGLFFEEKYWNIFKDTLDYITNLETIEQQYSAILSENAELENKITNLQEENKEWSMIFDTFSKRPYAHKYLEEKKKELGNKKIIGLDSEMIYKDYYDYKSRNEKAIKILKSHDDEYQGAVHSALNILQGEDKDVKY